MRLRRQAGAIAKVVTWASSTISHSPAKPATSSPTRTTR